LNRLSIDALMASLEPDLVSAVLVLEDTDGGQTQLRALVPRHLSRTEGPATIVAGPSPHPRWATHRGIARYRTLNSPDSA